MIEYISRMISHCPRFSREQRDSNSRKTESSQLKCGMWDSLSLPKKKKVLWTTSVRFLPFQSFQLDCPSLLESPMKSLLEPPLALCWVFSPRLCQEVLQTRVFRIFLRLVISHFPFRKAKNVVPVQGKL